MLTIYSIIQTNIQGLSCALGSHGIPERTTYILNETWTSSKVGPEDDHRRLKHVAHVY